MQSYVKGRYLTHDPEGIASFEADELITRAISVNILLGLYEAAERVVADAAAILCPHPTFNLGRRLGGASRSPTSFFFVQLGAMVKERHVFARFFYHDTLGEKRSRERDRAGSQLYPRSFCPAFVPAFVSKCRQAGIYPARI